MSGEQIAALLAGVVAIVAVNLYFFGSRRGVAGRTVAGVQVVPVRVRDGYDPARIEVRASRPVRLVFRREEIEGCSDTVLLPEWNIAKHLPAHEETVVEFTPERPGTYELTCGMHMLRGRIVVR